MPRRVDQLIEAGGRRTPFQGVSSFIADENKPVYLFKNLVNLEPAVTFGRLKKRKGYGDLITGQSGLTDMIELVDKNDDRNLIVQKSTNIYKSAYSGGYGALAQLDGTAFDKRAGSPTTYNLRMNTFERVLRAGNGLNATTDYPVWIGHIEQSDRYPARLMGWANVAGDIYRKSSASDPHAVMYDGTFLTEETGTPTTPGSNEWGYSGGYIYINVGGVPDEDLVYSKDRLVAGLYLDRQFYTHVWDSDGLSVAEGGDSSYPSDLLLKGLDEGWYYIYLSAVLDGYQLDIPFQGTNGPGFYKKVGADDSGMSIRLAFYYASQSYALSCPRITAVDVYAAYLGETKDTDYGKYEAYFIERIPLDSGGVDKPIVELSGCSTNNGASTITTPALSGWKTFDTQYLYVYNVTTGEYHWIASESGTTLTVSPAPAGTAGSQTIRIYSDWFLMGTSKQYKLIYDSYYRVAASEMYKRIGAPSGDLGLIDYRYKYGCEANRRYFIFGRTDKWGYFSKAGAPDVIPIQNPIKLRYESTGCVAVGRDVLIFSKLFTDRISVLSEKSIDKDESFLDVGCSSDESILSLSDDEAAWMSYKGPYEIRLRQSRFLGQDISEWWETTLSDAEKEACVAGYNYRKDQIWFFFPTYSDSDYPNGIIFVYDRHARRMGYKHVWYYFKSDHAALSMCINDDGHLLSNDGAAIVDWNHATPTETVETIMKFLLLSGPERHQRLRMYVKWLFVDGTFGDTITANIYINGSGTPVALSFDADYEAFVRYLAETFEVELTSPASLNDIEYNKIQFKMKAKSF